MKTLNHKTVESISNLNEQLKVVEKQMYTQVKKTYAGVLQRLEDSEDGITDFEIEVEIAYRENEEDDEPLLAYDEVFICRDGEIITPIDDGEDHNVLRSLYDNPTLTAQKHCWLLHSLYDDRLIHEWEKILRIRHVWFEVRVVYQYEVNLYPVL